MITEDNFNSFLITKKHLLEISMKKKKIIRHKNRIYTKYREKTFDDIVRRS